MLNYTQLQRQGYKNVTIPQQIAEIKNWDLERAVRGGIVEPEKVEKPSSEDLEKRLEELLKKV